MAVVGVLTKKSRTLKEFKHDLHSGESCQGNKENLQSLVHSVRKLQNDVNSCLTKIIEEEKTSSATAMSKGELSLTLRRIVQGVAAGFAPWQVCPQRVRPHIDSTFSYREKTLCAR